jgi:hypothetical protein
MIKPKSYTKKVTMQLFTLCIYMYSKIMTNEKSITFIYLYSNIYIYVYIYQCIMKNIQCNFCITIL